MDNLKIASRKSDLAMVQTRYVQSMIGGEIVGVSSYGDQNLTAPLYEMKGIGVFVKMLEVELLESRAQVAVHSLKDMPTNTQEGLSIAAVPKFNVPRGDVAVFREGTTNLEDLPSGSKIGTSSLRRSRLIACAFPHKNFEFSNIRGNLNTRVRKLENGDYDCILLAAAGIHRLNWHETLNMQYLDEEEFLYAPGQAALAIQCREDNLALREFLSSFEDYETRQRVEAERKFMQDLEGVRFT